jgi:beta-barrel assembly-enhancing protease
MSEAVPAWLFDGVNAVRHEVMVRAFGSMIEIEGRERIDPATLSRLADTTKPVFGRADIRGWRLGFDQAPPAALAALLPAAGRYGGVIDRFGLWRTSAILAALSVAVVAFVLSLPGWIGPYIPFSVERSIGQAMVGDLGGRFCKGPGGEAALNRLVGRVDPGGVPVTVRVVNVPMVNAVTLPGGTILVFDGLLREAKSPDEVAGVLGHELGHVRNRDSMQSLLRQLGLSVILGGFSGEVGNNMNALLSASYSRQAETKADDYSMNALKRARVSPRDTAGFFVRLAKGDASLGAASGALAYVASHPASKDRAAAFNASATAGVAYTPVIDQAEWRALQHICRDDPARKRGEPFGFGGL